MSLHVETPIFESLPMGEAAGRPVFLKMECFQPTGSFKIRGIGLLCKECVDGGTSHLVSSSVVSAMCYLTVSFGNLLTAGVNYFIQNEDGTSKLAGASYYAFFTGMMLVAAIVFVFVATFYQEKRYIHDEETVNGELSLS